jgi:D-amino-acid dehydrogenase
MASHQQSGGANGMRVIIIGAGVVGATTAYFVARRGHEVTMIERNAQAACGTSLANAAQLSYSYTDALASPGMLRNLPAILRGKDLATRMRLDAALIPWGARFLWHCSRRRSDSNTVALLHLAMRSAAAMATLLSDIPLDFCQRTAGKLILTSSPRALGNLRQRAELKRRHGVAVEILTRAECLVKEPALEDWHGGDIAGAAYAPQDAVGDPHLFATRLCSHLTSQGRIKLIPDTSVAALQQHQGRVVGIDTPRGVIEGDAVVICAGVGANALLRPLGLSVPIYPLKGYSITAALGSHTPQVSITDLDRRIVFAKLGSQVRLSGFVDFAGEDASIDACRIADLARLGRSVLPEAAKLDRDFKPWAGLRPATPSSLPIVGRTRIPGVHLNIGHGGLGWTLACATAHDLAEQLV